MDYPKWSDIADLVARLGKRKHPDCTAAALKLDELHARLHNRTADLEQAERRLVTLGCLVEEAAAQAREERNGAHELIGLSLPPPVWFQLLSCYRTRSDGQTIYEELKRRKILVRYMNYPGYGDGLRISVGTDEEIDRLLAELKVIG